MAMALDKRMPISYGYRIEKDPRTEELKRRMNL